MTKNESKESLVDNSVELQEQTHLAELRLAELKELRQERVKLIHDIDKLRIDVLLCR